MPRRETASITVGGTELSDWTEYEITSDITKPADGFSFAVELGGARTSEMEEQRTRLRGLLGRGQRVTVQVTGTDGARSTQLEGVIDTRKITATRKGGTVYQVNGRDFGAYLVGSDAPLDLLTQAESTSFLDVITAAVDPWGIEVTTDASTSRDILTGRHAQRGRGRLDRDRARADSGARSQRGHANNLSPSDIRQLTIKQAKPRPGQTVWDFLASHAARLRLMLWMSPDGRLVVGSPNYDQEPSARFVRRYSDGGNVLAGTVTSSSASLYSEIEVYGRGAGGDAARSTIRAHAVSGSLPYTRRLVVHDQNIRTQEAADARAVRELMAAELNGLTMSYTTAGHGQDGLLYAIDTVADVLDEPAGEQGRFYTVARTFRRNRDDGTTAEVHLVPEGAIQL